MTSTSSQMSPLRAVDLGTLAVMAFSGEAPDGDMPYLLAYSLGDGEGGPEGSASAIRQLLTDNGIPVGETLIDGSKHPSLPLTLLVEGGQAVVRMPHLNAQCVAPPEWLAAVGERGYAYFLFATRAWPVAQPGKPVAPEDLTAFAGDEDTLLSAAHVLLPARSLRG
ncbi:DUF5949 family protein [Streptomyces sp. NPDC060011]|uniref:DUF5949 family protein n=1 Tax=unclassified Streptomyces TaxID=2593676 RepID=UPI0009BF6A01|nr:MULTISPECIES: DUF5949 family protein [unclassified Streptomyces]NEB29308.1 hypothetical protein [Streptomyces sp. SID14446]MCX5133114.1 DUF5949 family protein [Streptomyces sp. NBC_00340]MCX5283397.1 DUF5949 family protein [Streptomyces sp. NBC_00198]OQQ16410.1 hypothetical protein B0675_03935 [Streptomyces sp. M41(2017)]WSD79650.1 DUF5949 family protein [Streptomyces sp. NBC_01558]